MAKLNCSGATHNISPQQLQYISEFLEEIGFGNSKIIFENLGGESDNYSSYVKKIVVVDDEEKIFKMIAKFAPTQTHMRLGNTSRLFLNEIIMYTEVLPTFKKLEETAKVPEKQRLRYAKCYGAFKDAPNEVILIEDLQLAGFSMLDKSKPLSDNYVKYILKELAKIHSLSYALKAADLEKFEEYNHNLYNIWKNLDIESVQYYNHVKEQVLAVLTDENQKEVFFKNTFNNIVSEINEVTQEFKNTKYTAILHGDPWTNNMMFKLDGERLLECFMIDYQVSSVGIPPIDLMYFIFICTDHSTRQKYFNNWIDYYYMELSNSLRYHGLDINLIYLKDELLLDLKKYSRAAFGASVYITYLITLSPEDAIKAKEYIAKGNDIVKTGLPDEFRYTKTMEKYKETIEGLIDSFVEFGLF